MPPATATPQSTLSLLNRVIRGVGFDARVLLLPAVLSALAALFETLTVLLLLPTMRGMRLTYAFIWDSPSFRAVQPYLPAGVPINNVTLFAFLCFLILCASLARIICSYASSMLCAFHVRRLAHRLRTALFERCLGLEKIAFDRASAGHLQHVVTGCPEMISAQLLTAQEMLTWLFILVAYVPVMFWLSWKTSVVVLVLLPVIHYAMAPLIGSVRRASKTCSEARKSLNVRASNVFAGMPLVKSYASEALERERFERDSEAVFDLERRMDQRAGVVRPLHETFFLAALVAFLFFVPFHRTGFAPSLLVYVYLLRRASLALPILGKFNACIAAVHGPLLEVAGLLEDSPVPARRRAEGRSFDGLRERIEFKDLSFRFNGKGPVLDRLSLSIPKGKVTAIVGPSGTGKTTLLSLILRFYDAPPGTLLIDGTDINEFSADSLMARIAYVGQETLLFNGSVRSNAAYGLKRAASDEDILGALKQAQLDDLLARLPGGLDTPIGDRGVQLSGGERQRLSIARAMLKGADILIMDEATSAVDSGTEALLEASIERLVKGKTSIVVAHRLSTIRNADTIAVLEGGRVVESGGRDELLSRRGRFYHYWEAQKFS